MGSVEDIAGLAERDDVNVLFVLIDTLRADHLGSYGYDRNTSPLLDGLASTGIRFDRQLAQSSWTKCSMASMWTGLYPSRTGVTRFDDVLQPAARLPAEILRDAGYRTAGVFRNGWVEGYFGFDQGFESYGRPPRNAMTQDFIRKNPTVKGGGSDYDVVDAAVEFLRIHGHERWFLYLHLMDIHEYTYDDETAVFGTAYSDVYDNAILRTNKAINTLVGHLNWRGDLDRTVVVIASDHGEAFSERGFEGHARNVYREETEVPLIIALPFRLPQPVVVRQRSANVDIWPTLLDLLGLPPLEPTDGRSRVPEILKSAGASLRPGDEIVPAADAPVFAHLDQNWGQRESKESPTVAVADDRLRYVMFRGVMGRIREQLYDFGSDRLEGEDVARANPDDLARMRESALEYLEREPPWEQATPDLELDEMQLNQLRALGYAVP
ncbi:MAG: sulfatase [Deltaproteobacteria bacterium]|nr:sulfatase [Deltaproteobacteria bacterium]